MFNEFQLRQIQALREALGSLGETADQVASSLETKGIKGRSGNSAECPIARLARSILGQGWEIMAAPEWIDLTWQQEHVVVDLPRCVTSFIAWFDHGSYSYLIDNSPARDYPALKTT